jgi:hypothetical protein
VLPREDIGSFLNDAVVPSFWPGTTLASFDLVRSRFSPSEECSALATLSLQPSPDSAPKVVVTFAPKDDLKDAIKGYKHGNGARVYSQQLGCIAEVFPADWRMTGLRSVMTPEFMLPLVSRSWAGAGTEAVSLDIRLLRYRPHSRAVIQYTGRDAEGNMAGEVVGKVYRSESKAKRMWRILQAVEAGTGGSSIVPRPLLLEKDLAFLLMAKAPGRSLQAVINDPRGADPGASVRLAARALRSFNATDPGDAKTRKLSKDIEHLADEVKETKAKRLSGIDARSLVKAIEQRSELLSPPPRPSLLHGAFKPSAVLIEGERSTFVDLDACCAGDPARDVGCFTGKLLSLAQGPDGDRLRDLVALFFDEYATGLADPAFEARVHFYESMFLAATGLKHLNTGWRGEDESSPGPALIDEARRRLELSYP